MAEETDARTDEALWDGDTGIHPLAARRLAVKLLKEAYVCDNRRRGVVCRNAVDWSVLMVNENDIRSILSDLMFRLEVNSRYRVAWATPALHEDSVSSASFKSPLSLNMNQTLMALYLRRRVMQLEAEGKTQDGWFVYRDELRKIHDSFPNMAPYVNDAQKQAGSFVQLMKSFSERVGFIKPLKNQEADSETMVYLIMPIIPAVFDLEELSRIEKQLKEQIGAAGRIPENQEAEEGPAEEAEIAVGPESSQEHRVPEYPDNFTIYDYLREDAEA